MHPAVSVSRLPCVGLRKAIRPRCIEFHRNADESQMDELFPPHGFHSPSCMSLLASHHHKLFCDPCLVIESTSFNSCKLSCHWKSSGGITHGASRQVPANDLRFVFVRDLVFSRETNRFLFRIEGAIRRQGQPRRPSDKFSLCWRQTIEARFFCFLGSRLTIIPDGIEQKEIFSSGNGGQRGLGAKKNYPSVPKDGF